MPAGELHEISSSIGWLKAEAESSREGRKVLHLKLDDMLAVQHQMLAAQQQANGQIAALQAAMNEVRPEVNQWRNLRNRAMGGLAVAGLLLSAGGAAVAQLAEKWLDGR
jgi:hypothetical protein